MATDPKEAAADFFMQDLSRLDRYYREFCTGKGYPYARNAMEEYH